MRKLQLDTEIEAWIERLREDGCSALRSLLRGSAPIGPLSAALPEDAMAAIVGLAPDDEGLRSAVDQACQDLLEEYRRDLLLMQGSLFEVELSRLSDLVSIVRRLLPQETTVDLHRRLDLWSGYFEAFVVDRGLDLRREFLRILSLSQELAAGAGLEPRRLMPLWLSICSESGDLGLYDQTYLRVALLGLRRLPLGKDLSSNEDFALQGLARWAAAQRPAQKLFEREWRILEGDFPRSPDFWSERVRRAITSVERELIEHTDGREKTFPLAAWWAADVEIEVRNPPLSPTPNRQLPTWEEHQRVLKRIGEPYTRIAPTIRTLIGSYRADADLSGDVFHVVRASCNVGMQLIKNGPAEERRARGAHSVALAAVAFGYDPTNVYAWSLMIRALALAGRPRDAEQVGWEAVRRFPENVQWRTQLATILAEHLGKPEEAAHLLTDALTVFPNEPFVHTQLATVLSQGLGKPQEAANLLEDALVAFPGDPFVRSQLATILADDLKDFTAAKAVLDAAVADGVTNEATAGIIRKFQQNRPLRKESPVNPLGSDESRLSLPSAQARQLLFRYETGLVERAAISDFLAKAPTGGYVTYMAQRTGVSDLPVKTTFAMAFDAALKQANPSLLRAMISQLRPIEAALVSRAIAASEGGVVAFAPFQAVGSQVERLEKLDNLLGQNAADRSRAEKIMSDFAASTIGLDTTFLAEAA